MKEGTVPGCWLVHVNLTPSGDWTGAVHKPDHHMIRCPAALRRIWWGNIESFPAGGIIHKQLTIPIICGI